MKALELDLYFKYDSKTNKGKHIIETKPSATVATTQIQPEDPEELKEGDRLFQSQMWVNGVLFHFIISNGSQNNLISVEVVKWLKFPNMPHPQPYNIRWLSQGRDLCVSQQCRLPYVIKPFKDEVLCCST